MTAARQYHSIASVRPVPRAGWHADRRQNQRGAQLPAAHRLAHTDAMGFHTIVVLHLATSKDEEMASGSQQQMETLCPTCLTPVNFNGKFTTRHAGSLSIWLAHHISHRSGVGPL